MRMTRVRVLGIFYLAQFFHLRHQISDRYLQ